jgi:hypothetical protein
MCLPYGYICGCYYLLPPLNHWSVAEKKYLAQVSTKAHTTILASTSRTTLTQTFVNPSEKKAIKELSYSFPLYDGVSVVGFKCRIGERTIIGEVKEKEKARADYKEAKDRGEVAGLLEQLPEASDVFITKLGNVPPGASVVVDITYLGELKHDAEVDGIRFTIPTFVAPRYGSYPSDMTRGWKTSTHSKGFEVTVDAELGEGAYIREMRSPSHPIAVSLGTTSLSKDADPTPNKASATLSLGTAELEKDFVLQVVAKETAIPKAMLETHPTIPGQRALMATLVPKFALPPERPEVVFVCDRSGSMSGNKIVALSNALKVFLKSLPVGTKFNICSFGSRHTFLWNKSESYSQSSLDKAMKHVETFAANYGGTEMFAPMQETIKRRYKDMNLEIFLVTDGEIWDQQRLFDLLNEEIGGKKAPIRVFTLGVGDAFSSSLIEGVARAGNGFSQAVGENEKLDGKVVRMLKAALSPHITDYSLEVKYADGTMDKAVDSLSVTLDDAGKNSPSVKERLSRPVKAAISLFDTSANPDATESQAKDEDGQGRFNHLPSISPPKLLQAPHKIPPLFPFSRTTVYLLVSPMADQSTPSAVVLKGTSKHGPLELEIPVQVLTEPGQTIHQLAAKKAVHELEEGRGWLAAGKDAASGKLLKEKHEGRFSEFTEREAVRLGVQFQVGGKFCSFVAVEKKDKDGDRQMTDAEDWEFLDEEVEKMALHEGEPKADARYVGRGGKGVMKRQRKSHNAVEPMGGTDIRDRSKSARTSLGGVVRRQLMSRPAAPPPPGAGGLVSFGAASPRLSQSIARQVSVSSYNSAAYSGPLSRASPQTQSMMAMQAPSASRKGSGFGTASASAMTMRKKTNAAYSMGVPEKSAPVPVFGDSSGDEDEADEEQAGGSFDTGDYSAFSVESIATSSYEMPKSKKAAAPSGMAGVRQSLFSSQGAPRPPPAPKAQPADPLQTLIELQTFEGYWVLDERLCKAMGVKMALAVQEAKKKGVDTKVLATALAVHFLTTKLKSEEESWELVVDKAKGWLEMNNCGEGSEIEKVVAELI